LNHQVKMEQDKADGLRKRAAANTGEDAQQKLLQQLHNKVREVYTTCEFDAESNPTTVSMLTELEAKLEDLLSQIESMPEEYVTLAEKKKEQERRDLQRKERIDEQHRLYEEKLQSSLDRAMQAPKKKTGRPVMARSRPNRRRVVQAVDTEEDADAADAQFFT